MVKTKWQHAGEREKNKEQQLCSSKRGNEGEEDKWPLKPESKLGLIYAHDIP